MSDCQLYLVTPPAIPDMDSFAEILERVLQKAHGTAAQIACAQLRLKPLADEEILLAAERLIPICHTHDCIVLINDRPDLALKTNADGVHIGQDDMSLSKARAMLGADASIGVTCHNSKDLAIEAGEAGADYVAFGAFYPTETKDVKFQATPDILEFWSTMTTVPCVAIGGITAANAEPLIKAGADFIAISSGIWNHPEGPEEAIEEFATLLASS